MLTESQLLGTIWQSQGRKRYSNILFHQFAQAVADNQKSRPSATTINNEREPEDVRPPRRSTKKESTISPTTWLVTKSARDTRN